MTKPRMSGATADVSHVDRRNATSPGVVGLHEGAPEIPLIRTARLVLRPFVPDDAGVVFAQLLNDPKVMAGFPIAPAPSVLEAKNALVRRERHWREHGFGMWAVTLADCGTFVGECGLRVLDEAAGDAELVYAIASAHWAQGYATEAAKAALDYAFGTLRLDRIVGVTTPTNTASAAVLRHCGMTEITPVEIDGHLFAAFALARS